jgi:SAM-dependent methyltransferase
MSGRLIRLFVVTPLAALSVLLGGLLAWHYPYATDEPIRREDAIREFYNLAYSGSSTVVKDNPLSRMAATNNTRLDIRGKVQAFVDQFHLHDAAVLDVGSGMGRLQDVVFNYTGLDIASEAGKFYHKRFVAGTATAMPFADNEFDAAWSIWVLEHIPNPEAALSEMRRVVRPGGLLFLLPAWDCKPWAAQGYEARPYSDFGLGGRLIKASIPVRNGEPFWVVTTVPNRLLRAMFSGSGPTRLHYRRLEPNFTEYWQADSDAVNDLDLGEVAMWFESRGDTCLSCVGGWRRHWQRDGVLIIRLNKGP